MDLFEDLNACLTIDTDVDEKEMISDAQSYISSMCEMLENL